MAPWRNGAGAGRSLPLKDQEAEDDEGTQEQQQHGQEVLVLLLVRQRRVARVVVEVQGLDQPTQPPVLHRTPAKAGRGHLCKAGLRD